MNKLIVFVLAMFLGACSSAPSGGGVTTPIVITAVAGTMIPDAGGTGPNPTPVPPLLVPTELKYRVLEEFPDFFFCDPDYYPIAREDEAVLAQQRFPELQANQEEFQAILDHVGLTGTTSFADDQKLEIYREYKKLHALYFESSGEKYKFQIQTGVEGQQGQVITATIDSSGSIDVLERQDGFLTCPICLAAGTLIDTPHGAVPVEDLRVGDTLWTVTEAGDRVPAQLLQTASVRVPVGHPMIHITLNDGREVWASAGHPTADGRILSDLTSGDTLDGALIIGLERVSYSAMYTYDILPSGETGFYWANGVLLASTMNR